jgi:sialic acid synthase SpsE
MSVFIIAEIGSNWTNLDDCFLSIKEAANAGASAAKFQLFTHHDLYGFKGTIKGELDRSWVPLLARQCDRSGIDFMCTAFSPEGFEFIIAYVARPKVASSCLTTASILKKVGSFNKPVYLSTGASSLGEILMAMGFTGPKTTPLYCVANYPAKVINLDNIRLMAKELKVPVGYSDHSIDVLNIPQLAVQMGAVVIEKHFDAVNKNTPDSPHSINSAQFRMMVDSIYGIRQIPRIGWTAEESDMAHIHRNRCIAIKDLQAGDVLIEGENYGAYRSKMVDLNGLSGFCATGLNGKTMSKDIKAGMGIGANDIR